jgi:hypothetical protein
MSSGHVLVNPIIIADVDTGKLSPSDLFLTEPVVASDSGLYKYSEQCICEWWCPIRKSH